jgi:hypothetical protein
MPLDERINNLLAQTAMNEKTGQLSTLYEYRTDNLQTILPMPAITVSLALKHT